MLCRVDLVHDQQSAGGYKSHSEKSVAHAGFLLQAVQGSIVSRSKGSCTDQESADVDCYQLFELIACADITKWSHRRKVLVANKWSGTPAATHYIPLLKLTDAFPDIGFRAKLVRGLQRGCVGPNGFIAAVNG